MAEHFETVDTHLGPVEVHVVACDKCSQQKAYAAVENWLVIGLLGRDDSPPFKDAHHFCTFACLSRWALGRI
jgi:hypothetical protein